MPTSFRSLGPIQNLTDLGDRVLLTTPRGALEIAAHASGALRVRAGRRKRLPTYQSLALTAEALASPNRAYRLEPSENGATVHSDGLTLQIQFDPLTLAFARLSSVTFGVQDEFIRARHTLNPPARVYGLGEKTGWLDKRGRRYTMRTSDVFLEHPDGIGHSTDPLYASFPIFIVHDADGAYGVFVDNAEFTQFDFTAEEAGEISAPADVLNYYFLPGPTLPDVLRQYTALTGRMPLPALWTLGYHQCRWSYPTDAEVRRIARELRARALPADALWLDIDYMDGYRVFTWDKKDFPRPEQLTADLKADGFHTITIVDPGVKVDAEYAIYKAGKRGGHFVKHANGKEYNGNVWPGRSAFPDFHRAETRAWWAGQVQNWLAEYGLSGLWNDMNEPATTDVTGPIADARHNGGQWPHASARNTFALQMARATWDGMLAHAPDARPFILTRAAFSGAQTVAALWCGDNSAAWEHLAASLPMLMNLGLSGVPFVGVDIGGFAGDTTGELLARWTQAGAFYPFCRNHAAAGTNAHEPWAFGPEVEAICRRFIELRYQLLPYSYNLFREAAQTGAPVMRPLVWHYPHDASTFNLNDEFLLGENLLVAPILAPGQTARAVYLPEGDWYAWAGEHAGSPRRGPAHILANAPLEELPLFVRGGAIIPMWPLAQHTAAIDRADVRLHIWPGEGQLDFYEDDGETRAFERGVGGWRITPFRVRYANEQLTLAWEAPRGGFTTGRAEWTFIIHASAATRATLDGNAAPLRREGSTLTLRAPDDGQAHILILQ